MPAPDNPYAAGTNPHHRLTPVQQHYSDYAVPGVEDLGPYTKEQGWSPELRVSPVGTPGAARLGMIPRREYRPDPVRPPEEFWRTIDADERRRHSTETQDADGWTEQKQLGGDHSPRSSAYARWAPDPRSTPPPEPRLTTGMAPRSYSFTRPFDQHNRAFWDTVVGSARRLNGFHFSMADHRRNYPILGMQPVRTWRNTYRKDPAPWDAELVDMPPDNTGVVPGRITSREVPYASSAINRSFRL